MDQKTIKLMTMHKALLPIDDVGRLYVPRIEGGKPLASIEDSSDTSIRRLEDYIQKRGRRLIKATRNNTNATRTSGTRITRKQKLEENQLYECFKRLTNDISHEKTLTWLRKGNLMAETESLLIAAQNNSIRTKYIKLRIDNTQQNSRCWLCGERDGTINHVINEGSKLAQPEYKTMHDWVDMMIL